MIDSGAGYSHSLRVRVFVDFWNFQSSLRREESRFNIDWNVLGRVLATEAAKVVDENSRVVYQGMNVYGSYAPENPNRFLHNVVATFPGVQVAEVPRQRRREGPRCPTCYEEVAFCPQCNASMRGTEEKGVDARIATDMIRLAWIGNYDVAVLASSDRDFIPVVEFLETRNIKVIHCTFPEQGMELARTCWGGISIPAIREQFRLTETRL